MRTSRAELFGKPRLLCFSTAVMLACCDRWGSTQGFFDTLDAGSQRDAIEATLWMAEQMMRAGGKYAERNGLEPCEVATVEEMIDICGVDDMPQVRAAILHTIIVDTDREQEAEPPKNAEDTPPDP